MTDKTTAPTSAELAESDILAALASITHEPPKRLPPGWLKFARAIETKVHAATIESQRQVIAGQVPAGWKLVPAVVTEEMLAAYWADGSDTVQGEWTAMLAAAPVAPHQESAE